jgi:hypothetical protein
VSEESFEMMRFQVFTYPKEQGLPYLEQWGLSGRRK